MGHVGSGRVGPGATSPGTPSNGATSDDVLPLPLTVTIPCRPAPGARAARHPVVVEPGWRVRTPHDERLERIAAAMGGGVSCLADLDAVLPGFAEWWHRARRERWPLVHSPDRGSRWLITGDGAHRCCPVGGFGHPHEAAAHAREVAHVAAVTGVERRLLAGLVAALGPGADPPAPGAGSTGSPGLDAAAWSCGLPPARTAELALGLARVGIVLDAGPEPDPDAGVGLLLAVAQTGADPAWLAASTAGRGTDRPRDAGLLAWLAWTCADLDRREPTARAAWLATGARRSDIAALTAAGYRAGTAVAVASAWGISTSGAAQWVARWVALGYRPTAGQLGALRDVGLGYPPPPPAPAAVARATELIGAPAPDVTAVALEFLRRGTAQDTAAALRSRIARPRPQPVRRAGRREVGHRSA